MVAQPEDSNHQAASLGSAVLQHDQGLAGIAVHEDDS